MLRRLAPCLLALLLAPAVARAADFDSTAALARARELRPAVSAGDGAVLWRAFGPQMRTAMKDSASFAAMSQGIATQLGAIDSVLSEEVSRSDGAWAVVTRCRFAKAPMTIRLAMAFDDAGRLEGLRVMPDTQPKEAPSAYLDYVTKTKLRPPFEGTWFVVWGGRTIADNYHAANATQRFATDVLIRRDGATHTGDGRKLTDYFAYGQAVLAPGDGAVTVASDTLPDQSPGQSDRAHPAGNMVLIDHGNGEYSLLAHLQPKSLRVKPGDRVTAGQPLGLCGNSGNTSEPHVHFHLQNSATPLQGDGLPVFYDAAVVDGQPARHVEAKRGQTLAPPAKAR